MLCLTLGLGVYIGIKKGTRKKTVRYDQYKKYIEREMLKISTFEEDKQNG